MVGNFFLLYKNLTLLQCETNVFIGGFFLNDGVVVHEMGKVAGYSDTGACPPFPG